MWLHVGDQDIGIFFQCPTDNSNVQETLAPTHLELQERSVEDLTLSIIRVQMILRAKGPIESLWRDGETGEEKAKVQALQPPQTLKHPNVWRLSRVTGEKSLRSSSQLLTHRMDIRPFLFLFVEHRVPIGRCQPGHSPPSDFPGVLLQRQRLSSQAFLSVNTLAEAQGHSYSLVSVMQTNSFSSCFLLLMVCSKTYYSTFVCIKLHFITHYPKSFDDLGSSAFDYKAQ